jgi:hypothetical protein
VKGDAPGGLALREHPKAVVQRVSVFGELVFPVDYINSDDEDERDADCSRLSYCQTELDANTYKE